MADSTDPLYSQAQLEQQLAQLIRVQEVRRNSPGVRRESARDESRLDAVILRVQALEAELVVLNHYLTGEPGRIGDIGILGRILEDIAVIPDKVASSIKDAAMLREVSAVHRVTQATSWIAGAIFITIVGGVISHLLWH